MAGSRVHTPAFKASSPMAMLLAPSDKPPPHDRRGRVRVAPGVECPLPIGTRCRSEQRSRQPAGDMPEVFFRPCRDALRFLPLFPSDESPGYYLPPSGLLPSSSVFRRRSSVYCALRPGRVRRHARPRRPRHKRQGRDALATPQNFWMIFDFCRTYGPRRPSIKRRGRRRRRPPRFAGSGTLRIGQDQGNAGLCPPAGRSDFTKEPPT